MRKNYSRLESLEERKNTKKAALFVFVSLLIVVFLATSGIPIITKIINFVSSLKGGNKTSELIDKTPPAPPNLEVIPDATNKNPLKISGYVEAGNTILININSKEDELQTNDNGEFSADINLENGDNIFFAYTKDPAGNVSQETEKLIIVFDNTPPEIKISSPSDGSIYYGLKQKSAEVRGSTEANSELTINDRFISVSDDGTFIYSYPLNVGENNLK